MKTTLFPFVTGLTLLLTLPACQSLNPFSKTPASITPQVVTVPAMTNIVTAGTNVTLTVTPERTVTNFTTNWVYSVNPAYTTAINAAKDANSTLNPTPTAPLINLGLGALAAGLAWFANRKNKQANEANKQADATQDLLTTVIKGVESIPDITGALVAKKAIAATAQARDVSAELNAAVQSIVPSSKG